MCEKVIEGKGNFGYNAVKDAYEDLVESGVIDPTKVVRTALENAASVATLLLTSDALIAAASASDSSWAPVSMICSAAPSARSSKRSAGTDRFGATLELAFAGLARFSRDESLTLGYVAVARRRGDGPGGR